MESYVFWLFLGARKMPVCVGCRDHILDRYLLKVAPDREWHTACLKCNECGQQLDETCTCFVREEKTYCKRDYIRYVELFLLLLPPPPPLLCPPPPTSSFLTIPS